MLLLVAVGVDILGLGRREEAGAWDGRPTLASGGAPCPTAVLGPALASPAGVQPQLIQGIRRRDGVGEGQGTTA